MLINEALDILEAGDDTLLARRAADALSLRRELGKFSCKRIKIKVSHTAPLV